MYPLMLTIVFAQMPKQAPWIVRFLVSIIAAQTMAVYVRPKLKENFAFVESELARGDFFVGKQLSGADGAFDPSAPFQSHADSRNVVMMIFPLEGVESGLGFDRYPNSKAWLERMRARPAYKRAEAKGGRPNLRMFVE